MNEENAINEIPTEEIDSDQSEKKQKKFLIAHPAIKTGSLLFAIIVAFFMAVLSVIAIKMDDIGVFRYSGVHDVLEQRYNQIATMNANQVLSYIDLGDDLSAKDFLSRRNIAAMVSVSDNPQYNFTYYRDGFTEENIPTEYVFYGERGQAKWRIYIIPTVDAEDDAYALESRIVNAEYQYRFTIITGIAGLGILLVIFATIFICGIGRSWKTGEVEENFFSIIPFDVVTLIGGIGILICSAVVFNGHDEEVVVALFITLIILFIWVVTFIHRIKVKTVLKNTLIFIVGKLVVENISVVWQTLLVMAIVFLVEILFIFFISALWNEPGLAILLTFGLIIEKAVINTLILYLVVVIKNLFKAGEQIANGKTNYKVSTTGFFGDFKKHGKNLNNLSNVVNAAVDDRIKSERMKTELITNVSHDIKTPLTSVINYSDLINTKTKEVKEILSNENIKSAEPVNEKLENIKEYSEVLNRQSNKLKRLLEDLVEISKASSGNVELFMEKLDVGTMLSQALGEYEERFEENNLEAVVTIPEEEMYVKADSRKLWRVFDNLLQNINKYAYPGTRVYIEAVKNEEDILIVFKNTSKEQITVTAEELTERFTRNDESRHMEGNGLGLAIAKTMTEVQGGTFKLDVDGDLFKVTITLKREAE